MVVVIVLAIIKWSEYRRLKVFPIDVPSISPAIIYAHLSSCIMGLLVGMFLRLISLTFNRKFKLSMSGLVLKVMKYCTFQNFKVKLCTKITRAI